MIDSEIFIHWHWLIVAAILVGAEMLVPGYFLIWIGVAAGLTGVLSLALPIGWPLQVIIFVMLSVGAILLARRYMQQNPVISQDDKLNRRADRLVGNFVTVVEPILNGQGKVKVADSPWIAKGPDASVGTQMRVVRVEGSWLVVEAV